MNDADVSIDRYSRTTGGRLRPVSGVMHVRIGAGYGD